MKALARIRLAQLPTPVEALPRLSGELGGPELRVKRDDQTGLAFGGNKTRKLEYLTAAAQAEGAEMLITAGAVQSNHCRQTAAAAARLGFKCRLVLSGDAPERASANVLLDELLGAKIIWAAKGERDAALHATFEEAKAAGEKAYLVPYGGSSAVGAAAYAFAIEEMLTQGERPDWIVLATSSGGTQAGLLVGARLLGFKGRILGISVDEPADYLQTSIARLATEISRLLDEKEGFAREDVLVNEDYLGEGYAVMGEGEKEAIQLFARQEGLMLDPVYTGRAAAGLIDLIRKGFFTKDDKVLFWHTGGTPALFAERYGAALSQS